MLMILGATFTGLAAWLILAGSGVRPTDGPWGRGAHVVCGWLTIQGLLAPHGRVHLRRPAVQPPVRADPREHGGGARAARLPPRARAGGGPSASSS